MNTANNARSRNTEKMLEETYLYLLSSHPKRPVNIVELCNKAKVNRATFYSHYTDILQLQEKIEQRMTENLTELFTDPALGKSIMTESRMTMVLESIKKNKAFFDAWYRSGRDKEPSLINQILKEEKSGNSKYRFLYCKAGINAIIKDWLENNCTMQTDALALLITDLSSRTNSAQ